MLWNNKNEKRKDNHIEEITRSNMDIWESDCLHSKELTYFVSELTCSKDITRPISAKVMPTLNTLTRVVPSLLRQTQIHLFSFCVSAC